MLHQLKQVCEHTLVTGLIVVLASTFTACQFPAPDGFDTPEGINKTLNEAPIRSLSEEDRWTVYEDPGRIRVQHGYGCLQQDFVATEDYFGFRIQDMEAVPLGVADAGTVILNGWDVQYLNGDHHVLGLGSAIFNMSEAINKDQFELHWEAGGVLSDSDGQDGYKWCYRYTLVFWKRGAIDAVVPPQDDVSTTFVENTGTDLYDYDALADVNGDGRTDLVGQFYPIIRVGLSTGSGFAGSTQWTTGSEDDYALADVNGDGRADLIGRSGPSIGVGLSTGGGFAGSTQWTTWDTAYDYALADVNGDGRADLVGRSGTDMQVALSTGGGFAGSTQWATGSGTALLDLPGAFIDPYGNPRAVLPRGFGLAWGTANSPEVDDHEVLQVGFDLGTPPVGGTPVIAGSEITWTSQTVLKDNATVHHHHGAELVTILSGESVEMWQPREVLHLTGNPPDGVPEPTELNLKPVEPGGPFCGDVGGFEEYLKFYSVENVPYDYAIPVLTGWNLQYGCNNHEVERIGVYLVEFEYVKDPNAATGTLNYTIFSTLRDNSENGHGAKYKVSILGLDALRGGSDK